MILLQSLLPLSTCVCMCVLVVGNGKLYSPMKWQMVAKEESISASGESGMEMWRRFLPPSSKKLGKNQKNLCFGEFEEAQEMCECVLRGSWLMKGQDHFCSRFLRRHASAQPVWGDGKRRCQTIGNITPTPSAGDLLARSQTRTSLLSLLHLGRKLCMRSWNRRGPTSL